MFDSEFFAGNRARLRELFTGTAPIVITAHGALQRNADETYPFHQDANFWYLTGINHPDVVLVMDKDKEYLIVPTRGEVRELFDGSVSATELTRASGVADVLNEKDGWKQLGGRLGRVQHVATLGAAPRYLDNYAMYSNPARAELILRIKEVNPDIELLDLRQHLAHMRMIKQPVELEAMQKAIDITAETLKDVTRQRTMAKYAHEYEIEADITRGFRRRGASGHAFTPIVAGGERACTLHNVENNAPLASDELVVLDVGAEFNHYAADITRTVSIGGKPSRRQQQVYDAVAAAQEYAFSILKPGLTPREFEEQVAQFVGEKLRELGLIKTISNDAVRQYFPHATSHFLGLDTHDAGDYSQGYKPGVVITVEPGIYIAEEKIGVRLEDNVLITEDGIKILTAHLPRKLA
jgi:Xaa-Pro aminopeptidase